MTSIDIVVFAAGWALGWLLLWAERPVPPVAREQRRTPIAVIVPARDESDALRQLVPAIVSQLRDGDEFVVVDDHSADDTAADASELGAVVVSVPALADGWLGKPHACHHGARSTTAPTLLFIDADVRPADDLLDRVGAVVDRVGDRVVSIQPWHATDGWRDQANVLFNVTALMGCGAFTIARDRMKPTVAFGPVLGITRATYERVGGHAQVRTMHTEDIGLARAVGTAALYTGRPDTTFRMYPDGLRQAAAGWTRSIATGARHTRWWITAATVWWVAALAGGWLASGVPPTDPAAVAIVYALCALQVFVLGRRAGSMHPITALLYPAAVGVFLVVFVRSSVAVLLRRDVTWKGREVPARSG